MTELGGSQKLTINASVCCFFRATMGVTYKSRIPLCLFWYENTKGKRIQTIDAYLKNHVFRFGFTNTVTSITLEDSKDEQHWFRLYQDRRDCQFDIPIGPDLFVKQTTRERIAYDLGWRSWDEWNYAQVSFRSGITYGKPARSIDALIIIASRTSPRLSYDLSKKSTEFTWVPLHALFPSLKENASFVGWKKAVSESKKLRLEAIDDKFMFERFFCPVYRSYIRTFLHLPIAVDGKIVQTVDFRDANPKPFEPLLDRSEISNADDLFHAMVTFRVEIGVSRNGYLLAILHLPAPKLLPRKIVLERQHVPYGVDIVPIDNDRRVNWDVHLPIVGSKEFYIMDMSTLSFLDSIDRTLFLQMYIFPLLPGPFTENVIKYVFSWRMRWRYTFDKPLTVSCKSVHDQQSRLYVSLVSLQY